MAERATVVSRHFLRRRARKFEHYFEAGRPTSISPHFKVIRATKGPFRWYVVRVAR